MGPKVYYVIRTPYGDYNYVPQWINDAPQTNDGMWDRRTKVGKEAWEWYRRIVANMKRQYLKEREEEYKKRSLT